MMTLIVHSNSGGGEKWLNSEYVLKVKRIGFTY